MDNIKISPLEIPLTALSNEALMGLIEAFVMREGTDYGIIEVSHEVKINQIKKQLENGEIKIVFDPSTDSATLITKREWKKINPTE